MIPLNKIKKKCCTAITYPRLFKLIRLDAPHKEWMATIQSLHKDIERCLELMTQRDSFSASGLRGRILGNEKIFQKIVI